MPAALWLLLILGLSFASAGVQACTCSWVDSDYDPRPLLDRLEGIYEIEVDDIPEADQQVLSKHMLVVPNRNVRVTGVWKGHDRTDLLLNVSLRRVLMTCGQWIVPGYKGVIGLYRDDF